LWLVVEVVEDQQTQVLLDQSGQLWVEAAALVDLELVQEYQ